jgi:hypothetical protein
MSKVVNAHETMTKCFKMSCATKEYNSALSTLFMKYQLQFDSLSLKLQNKQVTPQKFSEEFARLTNERLEEMKSIDDITRFYQCAISKCGSHVDDFKTQMIADIQNSTKDINAKRKQADPTMKKLYDEMLKIHKRRLALVKTATSVPSLITLINTY